MRRLPGALLHDLRLSGQPGPAVLARRWPADLHAAFPGPRRLEESWRGDGAAFARYRTSGTPLFLKYLPAGTRDPRAFDRLRRETAYLRDLAPHSPVPHAPLLHAAEDPARHLAHLLLPDRTGDTLGWGAFDTDAAREAALAQVVALIARHHAHWATAGRSLLDGMWGWDDEAAVRRARRIAAAGGPHAKLLLDAAGQLPKLLEESHILTLAHGDLHAGQVLWPREGGAPLLIDFGQAHTAPLGEDLAHLLYLRLDAADRAQMGPALREIYRGTLAAHGLPLSADELAREERLGLALNLLSTARQHARDGGSGVRDALERAAVGWGEG